MLIENGDGTYTGGPLDIWLILQDVNTKRFHPAFFQERPFPGPIKDVQDVDVVRLASKMHHTTGFDTWEAAVKELNETMLKAVKVAPENVWQDKPREWDGGIPVMLLENNWKKTNTSPKT
jgi:hypothetical protein